LGSSGFCAVLQGSAGFGSIRFYKVHQVLLGSMLRAANLVEPEPWRTLKNPAEPNPAELNLAEPCRTLKNLAEP
jgi:hypothetical protein